MTIAMPRTLTEVWGERVAQELAIWVEQVVKEKAVVRDEYREVLSRLDILEHDVTGLKDDVRQLRTEMNERFERMEARMVERFDRVNERFDRVNERFDRVNEHFDRLYDRMVIQARWLVGSIVLFGAVISILLAIGQFIK